MYAHNVGPEVVVDHIKYLWALVDLRESPHVETAPKKRRKSFEVVGSNKAGVGIVHTNNVRIAGPHCKHQREEVHHDRGDDALGVRKRNRKEKELQGWSQWIARMPN